jgi:glycosyltransferase involved in cell wall biosynthesis
MQQFTQRRVFYSQYNFFMQGFSIIVCTYNPADEVFYRLLLALENLKPANVPSEIILVDNNSTVPLISKKEVRNFLKKKENRKLVYEKAKGLTNARIRGLKESTYEWLVFFDDDNEPAEDFLYRLQTLTEKYKNVGVWGPGQINVQLLSPSKLRLQAYARSFSQERNFKSTSYDNKPSWQLCYPYGTGLCIRKDAMQEYFYNVNSRQLTLSDRNSGKLSSGGDIQIVLSAVRKGFYAGTCSDLSVNHLIKHDKMQLTYLEKVSYHTNSCYLLAHKEVFPDSVSNLKYSNNRDILICFYYLVRTVFFAEKTEDFRLKLAAKFGQINAAYMCEYRRPPFLIRAYEKIINA